MREVREKTAKMLRERFGIDEKVTEALFNEGILSEYDCRKKLLVDEYFRTVQPKEKQRVRGRLAEKYHISVSLVEKIVLKSTQ